MEIGKANLMRNAVNGPELRKQSLELAHPINADLSLLSCGKLKTRAKL